MTEQTILGLPQIEAPALAPDEEILETKLTQPEDILGKETDETLVIV